jgi:hypothetical protein
LGEVQAHLSPLAMIMMLLLMNMVLMLSFHFCLFHIFKSPNFLGTCFQIVNGFVTCRASEPAQVGALERSTQSYKAVCTCFDRN